MGKCKVNGYAYIAFQMLLLLVIYSICRFFFFVGNYSLFKDVPMDDLPILFFAGIRFDISGILYLNLLYIVFFFLPTPWRFSRLYQMLLKAYFFVVNSIGILFNVVDVEYYKFILKRTTSSTFKSFENEGNIGSLLFRFAFDYWYITLLFLLLISLMIYLVTHFEVKPIEYSNRAKKYVFRSLGFAGVLVFSVIGIRSSVGTARPLAISDAGQYVSSPEQISIVVNTPFSVIRTIGNKSFYHFDFFESDDELNKAFDPVKKKSIRTTLNKKNVVVIILESFSREKFGAFNKSLGGKPYKGYTPFLDSLVTKSLVFPNAFANGRKSIDALPSITASLPSLIQPYILTEYSSNSITDIAQLLSNEGYTTAFFHGAPNGSMGFLSFSKIAGYQKYYGKTEFNNDRFYDGYWGIWDEEFFQFFGLKMQTMQQPFLTTLFSVTSHHPFSIPQRYKKVFQEGSQPIQKCIRYTDNSLRLFFNRVRHMPWFKNTLFVITADHFNFPEFDEYKTDVNAFAIPLILYTPDGSLKGVDTRLAQQIDIMPTVLNYLHYNKPYLTFGNDLLSKKSDRFVINYIGNCYQYMQDSLVIYFDGEKVTSVFNYVKDPFLKNNLLGKIDISRYERKMKGFLQQYNSRMMENRLVVSK